MRQPTNQIVFKVFGDDYETLGEMFEGLSVDDVLDGMEGQLDYVTINGTDLALGFDRTRNSIAVLDDSVPKEKVDEAVALVKRYANGELTCSPDNESKPNHITLFDGNTYIAEFWA